MIQLSWDKEEELPESDMKTGKSHRYLIPHRNSLS